MKRTQTILSLSFGIFSSVFAQLASAQEPVEAPAPQSDAATPTAADATDARGFDGWSAALLAGNGFEDGVNVGFGGRLGMNAERLYLGGTFVYHLGESRSATFLGQTQEASVNIYYFGGEAGYDFAAGPVVLRPYGGFGLGTARGCLNDTCDTESRAYIAPGLAVLASVGGSLFVGGDARFVVPLDDDGSDFDHFGLFAFAGMRL
ncbi:MAG TPA: hypothetical protein PKA88_22735 [Polyangiaceae bacterium]|nr:hypothetical protein [Polyangiaceae bacterium]